MSTTPEMTQSMFDKAEDNFKQSETISKPSVTYWADAWRRLRENKLAMAGLVIICILMLFAIIGPYLTGFKYDEQIFERKNLSPNSVNWFGTDTLGRDLWTRAWYGARISLTIGIFATLIEFAIGSVYGGIAGSVGGRTDNIMMRFAEATLSFLGLGVQAPMASWGSMAKDALESLLVGQGYQLFIPAFLISLTMFAFNVLGDGLRDALDPQLRK